MFDFPLKFNAAYTDGAISGFNLHRNGIGLYVPMKGLNRAQRKRIKRLDGTTVGYAGGSTMDFSPDYENDGKYWFVPSSFGIQYNGHQYWLVSHEGILDVPDWKAFLQEAHDFLDVAYP